MYSGSSRKKGLLLLLLAAIFIPCAGAQMAQIPINMIEQLIWQQAFSPVPQNEFHQVFQRFVNERHGGRDFVFQMEIGDFTTSFYLYAETSGAFKKYKAAPQPAKPAQPAKPEPPKFPATHVLTNELKLFADQESGTVIATLKKGTGVQVLQYGEYADLDNITAKWAQVKTAANQTGWLFSGYLEETKK